MKNLSQGITATSPAIQRFVKESHNPHFKAIHTLLSATDPLQGGLNFWRLHQHFQIRPSYDMWFGGDEYFNSLFLYVNYQYSNGKSGFKRLGKYSFYIYIFSRDLVF